MEDIYVAIEYLFEYRILGCFKSKESAIESVQSAFRDSIRRPILVETPKDGFVYYIEDEYSEIYLGVIKMRIQ